MLSEAFDVVGIDVGNSKEGGSDAEGKEKEKEKSTAVVGPTSGWRQVLPAMASETQQHYESLMEHSNVNVSRFMRF